MKNKNKFLLIPCLILTACSLFFATCDTPLEWPAYTIVYHANGGNGEMKNSVAKHGSSINLDSNIFDREGHNFDGWARSTNGAVEFADGQSVTNLTTADGGLVDLYAVWKPHTYTVVLEPNGANGTAKTLTLHYGDSIPANDFVNGSETFLGWAMSSDGFVQYRDKENITNITIPDGGTLTLYARWGSGAFTVRFDSNGGNGSVPEQTVQAGGSITIPGGEGFFNAGSVFTGWNTKADGSGDSFNAGAEFTPMSDITLYAKWTLTHYTVTYDLNGGTGTTPPPQTVEPGASVTLASGNGITKPGFTFGGWNAKADGTGTNYNANASFTPESNITLYAKWPGTFTVSFDLNGGSGTKPPAQSVTEGGSITLPGGSGITMDGGLVFNGWNTKADGTGNGYNAETAFKPEGNITLYVRWRDLNEPAQGANLAAKLAWLQTNVKSGGLYLVEVTADDDIEAHTLSYTGKSGITITLRGTGGERNIGIASAGALFTVGSGVTLILGNNITLNGMIGGNTSALVKVNSSGALIMNAGAKITGNTNGTTVAADMGGGVHIAANGAFTMNGGEISGNTALGSNNGGGVYMADYNSSGAIAVFTMNGGKISCNKASSGGGVYMGRGWSSGQYANSFTMNGGEIFHNTASGSGGGVCLGNQYAELSMHGGTISNNEATGNGGGVYISSSSYFNMHNGTISGNYAQGSSGGGGVAASGGYFRIMNGVIYGREAAPPELANTGNNAALYSGGYYAYSHRGIFSGTNFTSLGDLSSTNDTIQVQNGNLKP